MSEKWRFPDPLTIGNHLKILEMIILGYWKVSIIKLYLSTVEIYSFFIKQYFTWFSVKSLTFIFSHFYERIISNIKFVFYL